VDANGVKDKRNYNVKEVRSVIVQQIRKLSRAAYYSYSLFLAT
jgi:hypothetical protein